MPQGKYGRMTVNRALIAVCAALVLQSSFVFAGGLEDVHPCDEYAAHPADPNRWAKGVADEDIIPGPAVKICRAAVKDYADEPRFQFQLGRALWAAHKFDEGLKVFLALEEASEYGPVYAYLGDAYLSGIGGVEIDKELAVSLYQIAAESGFTPAEEVLAEIEGGQSANADASSSNAAGSPAQGQSMQAAGQQPPQDVPFDARGYLEPDVMDGLHSGNFEKVSKGTNKYFKGDVSLMYLNGFVEQFADAVNMRDFTCVNLNDPSLVRVINYQIMSQTPGSSLFLGGSGNLKDSMDAAGAEGLKMLGDMFSSAQNGTGFAGGMVAEMSAISVLKANGETDATRLIMRHGCESEVVKRIYANVAAYVTGGDPIVSAEERERQARASAEKAQQAEQARLQQLRTRAANSCVSQFKSASFCGCLVETLETSRISADEWQQLSNNFKEIVAVGKKYDGFADRMKECRSKG